MTREEAIKMLAALNVCVRNPQGEPISDLAFALEQAIEALRAEPAKHGRWIELFETENGITVRCSECGTVYTLGKGRDPNYCGTCGARMDGGENDT